MMASQDISTQAFISLGQNINLKINDKQ